MLLTRVFLETDKLAIFNTECVCVHLRHSKINVKEPLVSDIGHKH